MRISLIASRGLLILAILLPWPAWSQTQSTPPVVPGNTRFAFKLFHSLVSKTPDVNALLAPTGLSLSFGLLDNGADAETRKQIETAFEFGDLSREQINAGFLALRDSLRVNLPKDKRRPTWMTPAEWREFQAAPPNGLVIADSIWFNHGTAFPPRFLHTSEKAYGMDIKRFLTTPAASIQVKRWARARTKKEVPLDLTTTIARSDFILVDITHFHSFWKHDFQQYKTKPAPFTLLDGKQKQVLMMLETEYFGYFENEKFQAVALPYSNDTCMYVFLPSKDSTLGNFEGSLSPSNWQEWKSQFKSRLGEVGLPRFKVDSNFDVRSTLEDLGLSRAFQNLRAFSPLVPYGAKLTSASQSTSLKVDERGTEAISIGVSGGVVGGVPGGGFVPPPPFEMIINRPFFFAIAHQPTGQLLFLGAVVEP
jgi:serine protease inhibitor